MSFHDKGFWIAKSGETDEETIFNNSSRIEQPKRSHQWFSDSSEPELFSNKKQSIQSPNPKSPSSLPWENGSTQFIDRLFGPDTAVETGLGTSKNPFQPDSTFGLSMSYTIDDPIFKKVNKVKDSENRIQPLREDEISMTIGHPYNKGESTSSTISFGGFQDQHAVIDTYNRPISSFDLLYSQPTVQSLDSSRGDFIIAAPLTKPRAELAPKVKPEPKASRKEAPNSFPSNVRSLIATGMLDGVPIKYISVTREELRGIIKGSGYLCGCQSCNYAKVSDATESESDPNQLSKASTDPIRVPVGPVTRARAKKFKEGLSVMIKATLDQANIYRPVGNTELKQNEKWCNLIAAEMIKSYSPTLFSK